jgi:hypothetical protein
LIEGSVRGHDYWMNFLRFWCGKRRRDLGVSAIVLITGACTSKGNYFDEPPPPRGGHGGMAGVATTAGRGGSGHAGTSAAGSESAGRMGLGGDETEGGTGGASVGGSGATGGMGEGATGGVPTMGGSSSIGGTGGETGGSGDSASVGGASAGVGGVAGTGGTSDGGVAGDVGMAGAGPEPCTPKSEVCDGLDNDCDDETDEEGCPADCTAKFYVGHSYLLCMPTTTDDQLAYNAATNYCDDAASRLDLDFEMALARIESPDENEFLKTWVRARAGTPDDGEIFIGANDIDDENNWVWGRGSKAVEFFHGRNQGGGTPVDGAFNDFGPDRPNALNGAEEDCGALDATVDWQWNDVVCSKPRLGFVCEQKP